MQLEKGSRLGTYEILSRIGSGGMGDVYKARDAKLGRLVAIKVLPEWLPTESERRKRFEQEARASPPRGIFDAPGRTSAILAGREPGRVLFRSLRSGGDLGLRLRG